MTPAAPLAWGAVALLAVFAAVLRWMLATRGGIWRDEGQLFALAGLPRLEDVLAFLAAGESHPPLYYALLRAWQGLFGASDAAGLALPVLCGVALVPATYAAGRRLFSAEVGLAGAALVAIAPLIAEHAALARPYALLQLLCLATLTLLVRALTQGGRAAWGGFVLAAAAMLWTHAWTTLIVAVAGLVALAWVAWRRHEPEAPARLKALLLAGAAIAALYAPWLPVLLGQAAHAGLPVPALFQQGDYAGALTYYGWTFATAVLGLPLSGMARPVVYAALALVPLGLLARRRGVAPAEALALALCLGLPLAVFGLAFALARGGDTLVARCFLIMAPVALLGALHAATSWLPRGRAALAALLVLLFAWNNMNLWRAYLATAKSNAREAAAFVEAGLRPGDRLVVAPEWMGSSFNRYFRPATPQLGYPGSERPTVVSFADYGARMADPAPMRRARAALAAAHGEGRRVWVVTDAVVISRWGAVAAGAALPAGLPPGAWGEAAEARAAQLVAHLRGLYGAPAYAGAPKLRGNVYETVYVLRFDPPAAPRSQAGGVRGVDPPAAP